MQIINGGFMKKELIYNVYFEDFNDRKIVIYNIFNHYRFYDSLVKIKKESGDNFDSFSADVKASLLYHFWSKSEYEIILTSWPPYVEANELDRLVYERDNFVNKNGFFYRNNVNLTVEEKIDIYDQVLLNWDIFIKYLWDNKGLIKKRR